MISSFSRRGLRICSALTTALFISDNKEAITAYRTYTFSPSFSDKSVAGSPGFSPDHTEINHQVLLTIT